MSVRILRGDCRLLLKTLPAECVQCVVTSPPYFGLRDYGVEGQIGLEASPAVYVAELVEVFREVRRVLRSDGTVWLNLGDSYAASARGGNPTRESSTLQGSNGSQEASIIKRRGSTLPAGMHETQRQAGAIGRAWVKPPEGLKQKDLIGIPWMVAFALRADGWFLRQDIIWSKPNAMPESVRDRCTKAHEYIFLLSKSERYFYDADAIAEPVTLSTVERVSQPGLAAQRGSSRVPGKTNGTMKAVVRKQLPEGQANLGAFRDEQRRRSRNGSTFDKGKTGEVMATRGGLKKSGNTKRKPATERGCQRAGVAGSVPWEGTTRNKRSVWTVTTQPFSEAHFATFPPALIEPCILAGSPAGAAVLDPFAGAGTTGLVADRLQRDAVLIELNPAYADMAHRRIKGDAPLFTEVAA